MQKVITFLSIAIGFFIGFKIGRKHKKVSTVSLWNRALTKDEIEAFYKADQLRRESYSKRV